VTRAYVSLGSNLGDRAGQLAFALEALGGLPETVVAARSSLWETAAVGPPGQGAYLNAVVALDTELSARVLLDGLLTIERACGRQRSGTRNEARTLDLDLLVHGETRVAEPGLVVPHPRLHERVFVLEPLAEIAPDLTPPGATVSVAELAARVRDPAAAHRFGGGWPRPPPRRGGESAWPSWR
jgi:2-amino-4-hydroxy-6-hydroxymethyldihydropteridine diphosphokinase